MIMCLDRLHRLRALACLAAMAVLGLVASGGTPAAAQATSYVPIVGSGSSWTYPALSQWATNLQPEGLSISYTPNGSAAGRLNFIEDQVDFAASDIAFVTSADPDPFGGVDARSIALAYSYIPDVAGGTAFAYHLTVHGHGITNMRLSGRTLAEIFTGHIRNWDNPAITHDYGAQLPSMPITVVTHAEGSGTSYFLTRWMWKVYPSLWQPFCKVMGGPSHCGPTEFFPGQQAGFKSLDGSNAVARYIAAAPSNGAIGYDEYAYALALRLPVVSMLNAARYYVDPTASNVAIALEKARVDENPRAVTFGMENLDQVYTDPDPRAYPLSSYSYLIVPRDSRTIGGHTYGPPPGFTAAKGRTLSTYVNYMLCQGQQEAAALGYSPLPKPLVVPGFLQDSHIPGAVPSPEASHYSQCHNPAYYNGVDVLTKNAPYPTKCQKAGAPLNCTVRTARLVPTGSR